MNLSLIFIYTLILLTFPSNAQSQFAWNGYITNELGEKVPFSYLSVNNDADNYIFMSDKDGYLKINYPNYSISDTLIISHISYNQLSVSCRDIINLQNIIITKRKYNLEGITISPSKNKYVELGNSSKRSTKYSQLTFNQLAVLFVPNTGLSGKLKTVRINMKNSGEKDWKYRPFRLRLFKPDSIGMGEEIIPNGIIASLKATKGDWVEIDLLGFNLELPEEGLLIAVQALPKEYYLHNGYIESHVVENKNTHRNPPRINSISVGHTTRKNKRGLVCWTCVETQNGFTERWMHPLAKDDIFMFHLTIEADDKE